MGAARPTEAMSTHDEGSAYIHIGDRLGDGFTIQRPISESTGESQIFLCTDGGPHEYAAKIYHKNRQPGEKALQVLRGLRSPFLVPVLADGMFKGRFYEILPYYREGTLEKAAPLDPPFLREVVVPNMTEALALLHENKIIHRDIKPGNIFFADDRSHVVLGDFGISSFTDAGHTRFTTASRTIGYSAPETCVNIVSPKSDHYSMGITLLHLVVGQDPFTGMNDLQITDITLSGKLSIPAGVPEDIAHLVRGLTVKEREDRWGLDQLRKWCSGEKVDIVRTASRLKSIKPYPFEGRDYDNLVELALAFAHNWKEAEKNLYRGLISETFKVHGRPDLASKVMDCEEEKSRDMGVARLIGVLDPDAPLCWKGEIYHDLPRVAEKIRAKLPAVEDRFHELLTSGVLEHFLDRTRGDARLIEAVKTIGRLPKDDAVYRLYFLLAGETGVFRFHDQDFFTVDGLMEYIAQHAHSEAIVGISDELLGSPYFFAWLDYLGFSGQVEAWRKIDFGKLESAVG